MSFIIVLTLCITSTVRSFDDQLLTRGLGQHLHQYKDLGKQDTLIETHLSYPLYLLHNVIGYSIIFRLKEIYDNQLFYVIVTTIFSILLAYYVTKNIERPTKNLKLFLTRIMS